MFPSILLNIFLGYPPSAAAAVGLHKPQRTSRSGIGREEGQQSPCHRCIRPGRVYALSGICRGSCISVAALKFSMEYWRILEGIWIGDVLWLRFKHDFEALRSRGRSAASAASARPGRAYHPLCCRINCRGGEPPAVPPLHQDFWGRELSPIACPA